MMHTREKGEHTNNIGSYRGNFGGTKYRSDSARAFYYNFRLGSDLARDKILGIVHLHKLL